MGWLIEFFGGGVDEGVRREEGGLGWLLEEGRKLVRYLPTYLEDLECCCWWWWWWWQNSKGRRGSLEVEIVLIQALST